MRRHSFCWWRGRDGDGEGDRCGDHRDQGGGQVPGVTKESDPRPEGSGKAAAQLDLLLPLEVGGWMILLMR
jgi:hypothetical protein